MPRGVKADLKGRQSEPRTSAQFAEPIAQSDDAMVEDTGEMGGEGEATGGGRTVRRRAVGTRTASRSRGGRKASAARKASGTRKTSARKAAGSRKRTGARKAAGGRKTSGARKAASARKTAGSRTSSRGSRKSARGGSRKSSR